MVEVLSEYVLGHSEREMERLTVQARLFAPYTEQFLRHAGLRPGMSVLDVGAGHGDVSLLAARLVGPEGRVVALDQSASAITAIERRAAAHGLHHVRAVQGDLGQARFDAPFDAIIGRFVLMYVPDVTASVRHLATLLRPGGVLAFQEFDFSGVRALPAAPTFDRAMAWMTDTLARAGVHTRLGLELRRHFLAAGLPDPTLRLDASVGGSGDFLGYALVAEVLQSLLPMMGKLGVAHASEVDVATLPQRMLAEVGERAGVIVLPSLVGAWAALLP
jgi:SAM-dependent methyltransferase